jgi:lysyl-tRNA synthetase, class II
MSDEPQQSPAAAAPVDENHLIAERKAKLERLREKGPAFPNDFRRDASADELHTRTRRA